MNLTDFMRDMASRALRLSRNTLDLKTSRELRVMAEELKKKSEEQEREQTETKRPGEASQ